jgi:hypothetical protein
MTTAQYRQLFNESEISPFGCEELFFSRAKLICLPALDKRTIKSDALIANYVTKRNNVLLFLPLVLERCSKPIKCTF